MDYGVERNGSLLATMEQKNDRFTSNAGETEVHLWKQALPISEDQLQPEAMMDLGALTPEEQKRISGIKKTSLLEAHSWMISRLFLRSVLAQYMQLQARDIHFEYGNSGKPYVRGGPRFSLSHTKGLCVLAVTPSNTELGVDVEWMRPLLRQQAVVQRFLTEKERSYVLKGVRNGGHTSRLLWEVLTRKEAWIKACGQALCGQWKALNTVVDENSAGMALIEREGRSYVLHELDVGMEYSAALCIEGKTKPSIQWISSI